MVRYSKKKYRKYRKFYRRYKRGGYIRSDKVVNATSRSSCSVKIRKAATFNTYVPANSQYTQVVSINPWVQQVYDASLIDAYKNVYRQSTLYTNLYRTYSEMYDEVKCDYFGVKVTVNSTLGSNGVSASVRLTTAWDRKGTYADTYYDAKYPQYVDICNLPSAKNRNFSNFANTPYIFDSVRASDFVEKYLWLDSSADRYQGVTRGNTTVLFCNEAWLDASNNFLPFSPTFYFALAFLDWEPTVNVSVTFTVDMYAIYSFRNPRRGQEITASSWDPEGEGVGPGPAPSGSTKLKKAPELEDEPVLKKQKVVGKIVGEIVDPEAIEIDEGK